MSGFGRAFSRSPGDDRLVLADSGDRDAYYFWHDGASWVPEPFNPRMTYHADAARTLLGDVVVAESNVVFTTADWTPGALINETMLNTWVGAGATWVDATPGAERLFVDSWDAMGLGLAKNFASTWTLETVPLAGRPSAWGPLNNPHESPLFVARGFPDGSVAVAAHTDIDPSQVPPFQSFDEAVFVATRDVAGNWTYDEVHWGGARNRFRGPQAIDLSQDVCGRLMVAFIVDPNPSSVTNGASVWVYERH